jgi:hypothetical protein
MHADDQIHDPEAPLQDSRKRGRGPALDTLADVRRQARLLFAQLIHPTEVCPLSNEGLRAAVDLLNLARATILDEQALRDRQPPAPEDPQTDHRPPRHIRALPDGSTLPQS